MIVAGEAENDVTRLLFLSSGESREQEEEGEQGQSVRHDDG